MRAVQTIFSRGLHVQQAVLQMPGRCCGVLKNAAAMNPDLPIPLRQATSGMVRDPGSRWPACEVKQGRVCKQSVSTPVASGPAFRSAAHGYSCIVVRAGPDASSASFLVLPLLICLFPGLPHLPLSWSSSSSDSFLVFPPHTLKSREAEPSEPASGKAGGEPARAPRFANSTGGRSRRMRRIIIKYGDITSS